MSEPPSITCMPNGPYVLKNLKSLKNSRGEDLPTGNTVALCRCGGSANKPFCDGTHQRNGFSGARQIADPLDRYVDYRGPRIVIHDNRTICAHAGHCTDGLASVFKYGSEPWIDPNGADAEAIVATIRRCPSGALSYTIEGVEGPASDTKTVITVTKDGPYAIAGPLDWDDQKLQREAHLRRWTLCRCGASKNKPFCDGSHWDVGFKDDRN